jgi:hypothetical protein
MFALKTSKNARVDSLLLQDTELQWRTKLRIGDVTVTQFVPKGNWFLAPSPAIKVLRMQMFPDVCRTPCTGHRAKSFSALPVI